MQKDKESITEQAVPSSSSVTTCQLVILILLSIFVHLAMMHLGSLASAWDRGQNVVSFTAFALQIWRILIFS